MQRTFQLSSLVESQRRERAISGMVLAESLHRTILANRWDSNPHPLEEVSEINRHAKGLMLE
jgi:hypothetical protein